MVQEIITEDGEDSDGRTQYVLQSAAEVFSVPFAFLSYTHNRWSRFPFVQDAEDVKNVVAVTDLQQDDNCTTRYYY